MMKMMMKTTKLKYFHPSGRELPNGSHYQKGGFLAECRRNANAFVLNGAVSGIILFPASANSAGLSEEEITAVICQTESTASCSVGKYFTGKYLAENGEIYDATSLCVAVNGLSGRLLLRQAETIAIALDRKTFLLKKYHQKQHCKMKNNLYLCSLNNNIHVWKI